MERRTTATVVFLLCASVWSNFADSKDWNEILRDDRINPLESVFGKEAQPHLQKLLKVDDQAVNPDAGRIELYNLLPPGVPATPEALSKCIKTMYSLAFPAVNTPPGTKFALTSETGQVTTYDLEPSHAAGTQGAIHRGTGPDGRLVAVKVRLYGNVEEAKQEAKIHKELMPCDGILELIDYGTLKSINNPKDPSKFAIILEPMTTDFEFLLSISGEKFSMGAIVQMMRELLASLRHMHSLNIVHRDIKPDNLMTPVIELGKQKPSIKIIDFGLAQYYKLHKDEIVSTEGYTWIGTIVTMSTFAHQWFEPHPRDDLQSFLFTIIRFIQGPLPWEELCTFIVLINNALGRQNKFPKILEPTMKKLRLRKEKFLQEFAKTREDGFRELVTYILGLTPDVVPNYDFILRQVEIIAMQHQVNSSLMDWIPLTQMVFGSRKVLSASVDSKNALVPKDAPKDFPARQGFRYVAEAFYSKLFLQLQEEQKELIVLEELSPVALELLKKHLGTGLPGLTGRNSAEPKYADGDKVFVSKEIAIAEVGNIDYDKFNKSVVEEMEDAMKLNQYVGFDYTFDKENKTIRVGLVFRDLKFVLGMDCVKVLIAREAELVKYPDLTFREEEAGESWVNDHYEDWDVPIPVPLRNPFGTGCLAFTSFRKEFSTSLTKGEYMEIIYAYKITYSQNPTEPPIFNYTFKLRKQANFSNFVKKLGTALKKDSRNPQITWSMDETPWETELSDPFATEEVSGAVLKRYLNIFEISKSNSLSLNIANGGPLPVDEVNKVIRFLISGTLNRNLRVKWQKKKTETEGWKSDFMIFRDTFYNKLDPAGVESKSEKYSRADLREWANSEAQKMRPIPNQQVITQRGDGYIILKTTSGKKENPLPTKISDTMETLQNSIDWLPPQEKFETVFIAYGYAVRYDGTVNAVVICQLYYYDFLNKLVSMPPPVDVNNNNAPPPQLPVAIGVYKHLHAEAAAALVKSNQYPNSVLSNPFTLDLLPDLGLEQFPKLLDILQKGGQFHQVGFAIRAIDTNTFQIAMAFRFAKTRQQTWEPSNDFVINSFILAGFRTFCEKESLELDGIEMNQNATGQMLEVLPFAVTICDMEKYDVEKLTAEAFGKVDVQKIRELTKQGPVELYCKHDFPSLETNVIQFTFLFVLGEDKKNSMFEEFCSRLQNIQNFEGFTLSADFRAIQPNDLTLTKSNIFYIETIHATWHDAVDEALIKINDNVMQKNISEFLSLLRTETTGHIRIGWTRSVQDNSYIFWLIFDLFYRDIAKENEIIGKQLPMSGHALRAAANKVARFMPCETNKFIKAPPAKLGLLNLQITITKQAGSIGECVTEALTELKSSKECGALKKKYFRRTAVSYTFGYFVNRDSSLSALLMFDTDFQGIISCLNQERNKHGMNELQLHPSCYSDDGQPQVDLIQIPFNHKVRSQGVATQQMYLNFVEEMLLNPTFYHTLMRADAGQIWVSAGKPKCDLTEVELFFFTMALKE